MADVIDPVVYVVDDEPDIQSCSIARSPWRTLINYFRVASNAQLQFNMLKEPLPDKHLLK